MEVAELSTEDGAVTKEGLSGKGTTNQLNEGFAISKKTEKNRPRVIYSKEDLLNLRESPASKLWPSIFSEEHVRHGVWDPEIWHQSFSGGKRCTSPGEELKKQLVIEDGIVLSPQRQSFVQGCQIPQSALERNIQPDRLKTGTGRATDREREGRSRLTGRVGRGKALDYKERTPLQERNKDPEDQSGTYPGPKEREREERGNRDRSERGYGKDKDRGYRERDKERKRSREEPTRGRNLQVRKKQDKETRNEEPEWFTFGPSSQFETMELKGFDEDEVIKRDRERRKSASDEIKAILSVGQKSPTNGELNSSSPVTDNSPSQDTAGDNKTNNDDCKTTADDIKQRPKPFDINDFFLSDTLLPFTGGVDQTSSRFCQFFGQPGSNYSSSRSGSTGFSSGGANTPRTPSPGPSYLFTPIAPSVDDGIESHSLSDMLQKSQVSVQPLLDEVMSAGRESSKVKGSVRLEDIEADVTRDVESSSKKEIADLEQNKENISKGVEIPKPNKEMVAFNMLVEKMKSSGTLPEKPQPTITGLPTRLLPRPPSPKRKTPRNTPSPLRDLRRSPSPTELLKHMTMQPPLPDRRSPSPAQVVPQLNRPPSPLEVFHKYNSIVTPPHDLFASPLLRRSPSPLAMLAHQRQSPPLGFGSVNMHRVPPQVISLYHTGPRPSMPYRGGQQPPLRKPQDKYTTSGGTPEPRSQPAVQAKPVSAGQPSSPHIPDRSFMPTSVMRKIHQDQKTPKPNFEDQSKARSLVAEGGNVANRREGVSELQPFDSTRPRASSQSGSGDDLVKVGLFQSYTDERHTSTRGTAAKRDHLLSPKSMVSSDTQLSQTGSPILQKPTAFKPLPGSPQLPFSSLESGIHSEPASPLHSFKQKEGSPLRPPKTLPHSAPCTPQRHPFIDKAALLSPQQLAAKGLMTRDDSSKPPLGLFGNSSTSLESQAKGIRNGITRVVAANEGRPLSHSYEQQPHVASDKSSVYEDAYHTKRSENLSGGHPVSHQSPNSMHDIQRKSNSEAHHENLPLSHTHRMQGGDTRPTPVHRVPRSFHGSRGPRPGPHVTNGRLSPSGMSVMHGRHPGRTPFNSPMPGMAAPPRPAIHPAMIPPHLHPAYLRMMSSAGTPMGMPSSGMSPMSMRMPPHSAGRYPMVPGHNPAAAMMYGGRPSTGYPSVNPAAMMAARSPHMPHQTGLQQVHGRRVPSPVMNFPSQSHSPGGVGSGNILSKWFSEDVLQQATPAQRHNSPDVTRKVVSVEELERQQAAAIN